MLDLVKSGTLRILKPDGSTAGAGFLVGNDLAVTCAHVVASSDDIVQFQLSARKDILTARILPDLYRGPDAGDIAFLRLTIPVKTIQLLHLGAAEHSLSGNSFQAFGYPKAGKIEGIHARGEILGLVSERGQDLLQLRSKELNQGHSGAPVWDDKRGVVVGMVVSVYKAGTDSKLRDTAFAIPAETLWQVCPEIQSSETSPYLGLGTFSDETKEFFFGREPLTAKLLNVLRGGNRFLAVFGPSGSGKSSVVQAGLLPALKKGKLPGTRNWAQVIIRPADDPLQQLNAAGFDPMAVEGFLRRHPGMERVVLFIDQFEELFTLCPRDVRERFVLELAGALENPDLICILSMRDEFYSSFHANAAALAQLESLAVENVPGTLKTEELVSMIEGPAHLVGLEIEEGLTERIIKDLKRDGEARSSTLPLLEFALMQLWENRREGRLTHEAYQVIGGVTGSLARWADDAYGMLSKAEQLLAENLLTSLVHLGDESQGLPDTRRRRMMSELDSSEAARPVIQHFIDRRLIVSTNETVELIHDAILREWNRLGKWLNENRNFLIWRQRLVERWREWQAKKGELLRGRELEVAQDFWAKRRVDLDKLADQENLDRYISFSVRQAQRRRILTTIGILLAFLILTVFGAFAWEQRNNSLESQSTSTAGLATQVKAVANEKSALQTLQAESTRAAAESTRAAGESTHAANVEATSTVIQGQVNIEYIQKLSETLSGRARSLIDTNHVQGLLLGVESYRLLALNDLGQGRYPDNLPPLLGEMQVELVQTLAFPPTETVQKTLYTRDGNLLATLTDEIELWDASNPYSVKFLSSLTPPNPGNPTDFAFNPAGSLLVTGHENGQVEIRDIRTRAAGIISTLNTLPFESPVEVKVAVSTDGNLLAVSGNGTILLLDISQPDSPQEVGHISHPHGGAEVTHLWFDPNSSEPYLVSGGGDDTFRVWNLLAADFSPTQFQRTILRDGGLSDIAISSKYVVTADTRQLGIYHNFTGGFLPIEEDIDYTRYHDSPITGMVINRENTKLFTASQDGRIVEWDITNPRQMRMLNTYSGHTNRVNQLILHPTENFLVSAGNDSRALLWDVSREAIPSLWQSRIKNNSEITTVSFGRTSSLLVTGDTGGNVILWDMSNPRAPKVNRQIIVREDPVVQVGISPDESLVVYIGKNSPPYRPRGYMLNILKGTTRGIFELNTTDVFAVGNRYVLAGEVGDGTLKIFQWDISSSNIDRENRPVRTGGCPYRNTSFASATGLAAVATCKIELWDFSDEIAIPTFIKELDSTNPNGVALNSDGTLLASANPDNSFSIWNLSPNAGDGILHTTLNAHQNGVTSVAISPDGRMLATGGIDRAVILWDISSPENPRQRVILNGHSNIIHNNGLAFTADGKTLISVSSNEIILWDIDPESWLQKACNIAGRNLTKTEWETYVGSTIPYHATCSEFPVP